MKKINLVFLLVLAVGLVGCSGTQTTLETYIDQPEYFVKDPHFDHHQTKLNRLESRYLNKDITYAEYLEEKKELETQYTGEVQKRESKMMSY